MMETQPQAGSTAKDRINISDLSEVTFWTDKFDITKVRLKAAVNAAGPLVKDVELI